MSLFSEFRDGLIIGYNELSGALTFEQNSLINVLVFAILISVYSIFTWKFYKYMSKKDLIELNLKKYNTSEHPFLSKFFGVLLYIAEYLIILPFLIFFWFAVLALIILVLSSELKISQVVIVSSAVIAAIRMLAYYENDLSQELAKMFPFTVLTIFILTPGFFSIDRVINNLYEIPSLLGSIVYFFGFIIILELILRVINLFVSLKYDRD